MVKRVVAGALWLFATAWGGNFLVLYLHVPSLLVPLMAIATGFLVTVDPFRWIWPHPAPAERLERSARLDRAITQGQLS